MTTVAWKSAGEIASRAGAFSLDELGDDFGEAGGKAKTMGMTGVDGVRQMLGFLIKAKHESGNFQQAMAAMPQIFDQLNERTSKGFIT